MASVGVDPAFWAGRRVLLTGHTGFKGSWLSLWLQRMGAELTGFATAPPSDPSLFEVANVAAGMNSIEGDIRDLDRLTDAVAKTRPEVVIHMAAQSLVRTSYRDPLETYAVNVMGTVHLLEAIRRTTGVRAVLNVTTDKCYENVEQNHGYVETDRLGGHDPYSNSKACSELVTASYRNSFFTGRDGAPAIASGRAGNVIGGGDWAEDRLVPDLVQGFITGSKPLIRNPDAVRPWQHVLDPLAGYLVLLQRLYDDPGLAGGWNFGPLDADSQPVRAVADKIAELWGDGAEWVSDGADHPHEAGLLKLDISQARSTLGWEPRWQIDTALTKLVEWYRAHSRGDDMRALTVSQIESYSSTQAKTSAATKETA